MSGLQLAGMPAADMLDVLHYFFEEDLNVSTAEQAEARDKTRMTLYRNLYNKEYKYARPGTSGGTTYIDDEVIQPEEAPIEPFNPAVKPKPYRPPTEFNPDSAKPFGSTLDAPLG